MDLAWCVNVEGGAVNCDVLVHCSRCVEWLARCACLYLASLCFFRLVPPPPPPPPLSLAIHIVSVMSRYFQLNLFNASTDWVVGDNASGMVTPPLSGHGSGAVQTPATSLGFTSGSAVGNGTPSHRSPIERARMEFEAAAVAAAQSRYAKTGSNVVLIECKITICKILGWLMALRLDYQMSGMLHLFYSNSDLFLPPRQQLKDVSLRALSKTRPRLDTQAAAAAAGVIHGGVGPRRRSLPTHVHHLTSLLHPQAKVEPRGKGGLTLHMFEQEARRITSETQLSMQGMCPNQNVVGVLLDLMMYEDQDLTAMAIELLVLHFNSFARLNKALNSVQLLVSSAAIATYRRVAQILPRFRVLCETSEVWMGVETSDDLRTGRQVVHILHLLADLMWVTEEEQLAGAMNMVDPGSTRNMFSTPGTTATTTPQRGMSYRGGNNLRRAATAAGQSSRMLSGAASYLNLPDLLTGSKFLGIDGERQHLMHNMGVSKLVMTLLQNGYSMLVNRKNARRARLTFVKSLFHIFSHCYRFLRTFVSGMPEHQIHLAPARGLYVHLLTHNLLGPELLADIFTDHFALCREAKGAFLRIVVDHIETLAKSSRKRNHQRANRAMGMPQQGLASAKSGSKKGAGASGGAAWGTGATSTSAGMPAAVPSISSSTTATATSTGTQGLPASDGGTAGATPSATATTKAGTTSDALHPSTATPRTEAPAPAGASRLPSPLSAPGLASVGSVYSKPSNTLVPGLLAPLEAVLRVVTPEGPRCVMHVWRVGVDGCRDGWVCGRGWVCGGGWVCGCRWVGVWQNRVHPPYVTGRSQAHS